MQIISSWADINLQNHIFLKVYKEINSLINPLIEHFELDTFNYFKTYNDNSQIRLSNTPDWLQHYLTNKLYQQSVFELPAHNYMRNRTICSNVDSHNHILQEAAKFNLNDIVTFVEPVEDGCEFYFLGTASHNNNVVNKYLSNFLLLEKFITYFHHVKAPLIAKVEAQRTIAQDWYHNKLDLNQSNIVERFSFLNSLYKCKFTKRELDCIPFLIKGYSAKQIAENLNLSFRTIESYINSIKIKTKSNNKNELLAVLYDKFG